MVLPILAKGLMGGVTKGVTKNVISGGAKKAISGTAKKFVKGKSKYSSKNKVENIGRNVSKKTKSRPSTKKVSSTKLLKSAYRKSSESSSSTKLTGKVSFESLSKQLESIDKTTQLLVKVSEDEKKSKKELYRETRNKLKKEKARKKEEQLEKKRIGSSILGVGKTIGKNFNIFDFLTNIALGGLTLFLLNNYKKIENVISTLSQNFSNPFKLLKSIILGITSVFGSPIKGIFNTAWKGMKKAGSGLKSLMKKVVPKAKRLFGGLGSGLVNFIKNVTSKFTGGAASAGVSGTAQGLKRSGRPTVATQASQSAAKTASTKATQQASKQTAKNLFGTGGTRILKIGNIFKRVPVVGGLLSIFIDMLLGEPLDRAVVGAIGGGIGAWIGGGIGSLVFPFAGTAAGAILGGMIGDWGGKALYELFKKKYNSIPPVRAERKFSNLPWWRQMMGDEPWIDPATGQPVPFTSGLGQYGTTGTTTGTTGTTTSGTNSGASGASPTGYSSNLGPSPSAQRFYNNLGITASQWKTYKDTLASIETSGHSLSSSYGAIGGSGSLYDGRYQMGALAKTDAANILGIPVPSRSAFRANPQLQEDMILAYTVQNHRLLSGRRGSQRYRDANGIERLSYLGFAHNQGWVHAANWLDSNMTKDPTRDGFGTSGTKFTKALVRAFGQSSSTQRTQTTQIQQSAQRTQQKIAVLAYGTNEWGRSKSYIVTSTKKLINGLMAKGYNVVVIPPSNKLVIKSNPRGNVVVTAPHEGVTTAAAEMGCQIDYGVYAPIDLYGNYVHLTPQSARAIKNKYKPDIVVGDSNAVLINNGKSATAVDGAAYAKVSGMIGNLTATTSAQLASNVQTQGVTGVIKKQGATTGTRKHDMISGFPVTSPYGPRWGTMHKGIDIGTPEGTYVALDVDVEIMYSGLHGSRPGKGYGNVVDAWAPSLKLQFRLAHLNKRLCSTGQKIPAGVPLGRTGGAAGDIGRGSSDGPHLHFEVDRNKNGTVYGGSGDPSPYVGHLILSSTKPTGQAPNQTATLVPGGGQQQRQVAGVQNYASYERGGGGGVSMVPIPGQTPSAGGGGGGMSMVGGSTKDLVNSYYKSQLMGFLYKQG